MVHRDFFREGQKRSLYDLESRAVLAAHESMQVLQAPRQRVVSWARLSGPAPHITERRLPPVAPVLMQNSEVRRASLGMSHLSPSRPSPKMTVNRRSVFCSQKRHGRNHCECVLVVVAVVAQQLFKRSVRLDGWEMGVEVIGVSIGGIVADVCVHSFSFACVSTRVSTVAQALSCRVHADC